MGARKRTPSGQIPLDPELVKSFHVQRKFRLDEDFVRGGELFTIAGDYRWHTLEHVYMKAAVSDIDERVDEVETILKHGIQPALARLVKAAEFYGERDTTPAAASAEYEWLIHVEKAADTVQDMLASFDDLDSRLSCYVSLIGQLRELLKLARSMGSRHLREAVLTLHDALCGTYSEDLDRTQAEFIKKIVTSLGALNWNREMVLHLDDELTEAGFETVPSDKSVSVYGERSQSRPEATIPGNHYPDRPRNRA